MATTSRVIIKSQVTGLPEGGSAPFEFVQKNTTGVRVSVETTAPTGISSAASISNPVNAKFFGLVMPTTNTNALRVTMSTAEVGIPFSSQGMGLLTIPPSTTPSTYYLYTTGTRPISGLRVLFL